MGLSWLAIWKHHGAGDTRRDFLEAAVHGARVLANKIGPGSATASPWPFRVFAESGKTRGGGELYSAHVIWNVQLLDAVLAIPAALSAADAAAARRARSQAWQWLIDYPLSNDEWCGYCEDLTLVGLSWLEGDDSSGTYPPAHKQCTLDSSDASTCHCDYDSITFRLTSRYLMGIPAAGGIMPPNGGAGDDTPVPWQTAVPKMLAWVESALIFWDKPGPRSPPVQYGARCVSEQRDDPNRMSCHTSSVSAATVGLG